MVKVALLNKNTAFDQVKIACSPTQYTCLIALATFIELGYEQLPHQSHSDPALKFPPTMKSSLKPPLILRIYGCSFISRGPFILLFDDVSAESH